MSGPDRSGDSVRYYCTAGTGMERFLLAEVKDKLAAEDVCQTAGKVLFSSSAGIHRVRELKAAERLFLLLRRDAPVHLPAHSSPAKAAAVLRSRVLGDATQWTGAAATWSRLQAELEEGRRGEGREEEKEEEEEEEEEGRLRTCGSEAPTLKRKRDEEAKESSEEKRSCKEDDGGRGAPAEHPAGATVHHVKPTAGSLRPPDPAPPRSFRVSCRCTGTLSRCFSSQEVSRLVGGGLSRTLGWRPDLKNAELEVNVSLSDDHFLLGFPLTRLPLANRSYMKTTGLRSTVAWAMASLAQIQPGSCVLDPMCGVGSILIEAAQEHKAVCFLGLDIDDGQLQRANQNVAFAALQNRIQLLKASCLMLPLPSCSVDAIVCDLPFGRKFGTKTNMAADLPLILTEMERVLRVGGTLVLLLSPQLSRLLKDLLSKEAEPRSEPQEKGPQSGPLEAGPRSGPLEAGPRSGPLEAGPRSGPHSSLQHLQTVRVSLGAIDGLIHQYVKTDT